MDRSIPQGIKNVVFDFGGVLIDWNPRHLYRKVFPSEEEMEWFLAHVCTSEWNVQMDAGRPFAEAIAALKGQKVHSPGQRPGYNGSSTAALKGHKCINHYASV